jgi:hypothetical protein
VNFGDIEWSDATRAAEASQTHVRSCPTCGLAPGNYELACPEGKRTIREAENPTASDTGVLGRMLAGLSTIELLDAIRAAEGLLRRRLSGETKTTTAPEVYVMPRIPEVDDRPGADEPHLFRVTEVPGGFEVERGNMVLPGAPIEEGVFAWGDGVGINVNSTPVEAGGAP